MNSPSRVLQLNFNGTATNPLGMTIQNQTFYNVEIRANYGPGGTIHGSYGPVRTIFVGGTSSTIEAPMMEEPVLDLSATLEMYPNPSYNDAVILQTVAFVEEQITLKVYDPMGRLVYSDKMWVENNLQYELPAASLFASGVYTVELNSNSTTLRGKLMIQH